MTEEERTVRDAQERQRRNTFLIMRDTLASIRQDAIDCAEEFRKKYKILPSTFIQQTDENEYSFLPHLDYNVTFHVSSVLEFRIDTKIEIAENNDVYYVVSVYLNFLDEYYTDALSGNIFIQMDNVEGYVKSVKQAFEMCYKKYIELHEHIKDCFF